MTGKGWITGEDIRSRPLTHIPQDDWDRIFKKGKYANKDSPKKENGDRPTDQSR